MIPVSIPVSHPCIYIPVRLLWYRYRYRRTSISRCRPALVPRPRPRSQAPPSFQYMYGTGPGARTRTSYVRTRRHTGRRTRRHTHAVPTKHVLIKSHETPYPNITWMPRPVPKRIQVGVSVGKRNQWDQWVP